MSITPVHFIRDTCNGTLRTKLILHSTKLVQINDTLQIINMIIHTDLREDRYQTL